MTYEKFKNKIKELDDTATDATVVNFTRRLLILFIIVSTALAIVTYTCTRQNFKLVVLAYIVIVFGFKCIMDYAVESKECFQQVKKALKKYHILIDILSVISAGLVVTFV